MGTLNSLHSVIAYRKVTLKPYRLLNLGALRELAIASILFCAPAAWAGDYATCILDKAPGVANEAAAAAVHQVCLEENPGGLQAVAQGSGRGFFGFKSGAECTAKKASDTRSARAGLLISGACRRLYDSSTDRFGGVLVNPTQ